jgi:hypothetical protein
VEFVDGVGGGCDRGVEAERDRGLFDVVVDGLRHAHDGNALGGKAQTDAERAVSADRDEGVEAHGLEIAHDLRGAVGVLALAGIAAAFHAEGAHPVRGSEDGAAEVNDPAHVLGVELVGALGEEPLEAVLDSPDLPA